MIEDKKLWQKISGSITFYLKDYLDHLLPNDLEDDGVRRYLDKQTYKYVEVSKELEEKAISAFIERLNKRRSKEESIEKVEKEVSRHNVVSFESYKEDRQIKRK